MTLFKLWPRFRAGTLVLGAVLILGVVSPAAGLNYTTVDLHPSGFLFSEAHDVDGYQQVGVAVTGVTTHALLWTNTAVGVVDLNPPGYENAGVSAISGGRQVGGGNAPADGGRSHALMWSGTAASVVDLHPGGFVASGAFGADVGQQVGFGQTLAGNTHALLWSGTAASVIDLHPPGFRTTTAFGVSGGNQVGFGNGPATNNESHALLWSGTAASVVDLHPAGFFESQALGISDGQQVGLGLTKETPVRVHALLWSGTAASVVDLHPAGFFSSQAHGVAAGHQVGSGGGPDGDVHALLWSGTAASVVDLNEFLPEGFTDAIALGIDTKGNIVGFASGADGGANRHAFLWQPVELPPGLPVPGSLWLLCTVLAGLSAWNLRSHRGGRGLPALE